MFRKLFVICLCFLSPMVVFARVADPEMFPKNTPLRPPAKNVSPNYSNNINSVQEPGKDENSSEINNEIKKTVDSNSEDVVKEDNLQQKKIYTFKQFPTLLMIVFATLLVTSGAILYLKKNRITERENN